MESEETLIQCPKGCGNSFTVSQMHRHLNECKGKPNWIWNETLSNQPISSIPKEPIKPQSNMLKQMQEQPILDITINQPPIELPKERLIKKETIKPSWCKSCGSELIQTDSFKVCPKCKWIKVKPKYIGFFVLRYSMLIFWLGAGVGFILFAWGVHTYGNGIIP